MAIPDYKLSAVLVGHSMDVRCVAKTNEHCILSASRDRTAKLWHPEGVKDYAYIVTYKGHKNFVSCVCWLPPCESFPEGLVITGSNDNTIIGYNLQDGSVQINLNGHENAVCNVKPGQDFGIVLSSSWDNTARVWNVNSPQMAPIVLKGHQAAVWSTIVLGNGTYATASADKTIKVWRKDGALITTLTGHTDCVRDLSMASSETFLSCSNDASIRLWTNKGECLNTYFGHTNYIYCISVNPTIEHSFASCGEDGSLRIWQAGDCVRELRLPVQSVWSVVCLDNGDIVTGSNDGLVRVFTKDPQRYAEEKLLKQFDEEVENLVSASQQEIGGFKLSDLPGPEALLEPGKTNGQTKMVRRGTNVKCYSWDAAQGAWAEIGVVLGTQPPSEGKTMYQGKEYDFVFSVDIKDGEPPIKLPFNKTEDPWVAAQSFIHKNNLPQVYLEQVANFIITNAKLTTLPTPNNGFADPFTGESRYVPGSGTGANVGAARDPFTGAGAYVTPGGVGAASVTGDERPLIPHDSYIRFDQANVKAIQEKLKEFNSRAGESGALSNEQLEEILKLGDLNSVASEQTISLLKRILEWPKDILFPALDITRLAVRNKSVNGLLFETTFGPKFMEFLLSLLTPDNLPANQMLSMRVMVNAFSDLPGEMMVLAARESIVNALLCLNKLSNNAQIAAASLTLNMCVALATTCGAELADGTLALLPALTDSEAYLRALVALGTLLAESPNKLIIQTKIVSNTQVHNRLKTDCNTNSDPKYKKIASCSQQILRLL